MNHQQWSKETKVYDLSEGFTLEHCDWKAYSPWFATYVVMNTNIWFRQSFDRACSVIEGLDICYWIKKDGQKIGGVLIEPNYMNCLFLIPPYSDYGKVVRLVKNILVVWSDLTKDIVVGGAKPNELPYFFREGFRAHDTSRCMIRPTEVFDITWSDEYHVVEPTIENADEIAELFYAAFTGGAGSRGQQNQEGHKEEVGIYFKYFSANEVLKNASTLIYDKKTNKLIGACLVSMWEGWPNVYDIGLHPAYQGKGLASMMLKKVLTMLHGHYPVTRLFVTLGNDAEYLYHKLGFMPGIETTEMRIPAKKL